MNFLRLSWQHGALDISLNVELRVCGWRKGACQYVKDYACVEVIDYFLFIKLNCIHMKGNGIQMRIKNCHCIRTWPLLFKIHNQIILFGIVFSLPAHQDTLLQIWFVSPVNKTHRLRMMSLNVPVCCFSVWVITRTLALRTTSSHLLDTLCTTTANIR